MKYAIPLAALLLVAGCASSLTPAMTSSTADPVQIQLAQLGTPPDMYYFAGPVALQYQLTVTNPTNQTITLRRLNLRTQGPGSYYLRTGDSTLNRTIPPNGTTTIDLQAWGRSSGSFLRGGEPVNIVGTAYFDRPNGSFAKTFVQYLPQ